MRASSHQLFSGTYEKPVSPPMPKIETVKDSVDGSMKDLENQDKLGNFEIQ